MKSIRGIRGSVLLLGICFVAARTAHAQCSFTSGSTGADGAFTPTNSMPGTGWSVSNNVVTVTNSANGVFNFTSVYIETNWTVKFTQNSLNTPVYLLAQSNVTIKGTIDVSGAGPSPSPSLDGGKAGPGGFDGGTAGISPSNAGNGFGPSGGQSTSPGVSPSGAGFATQGGGPNPGLPYGTIEVRPFIGGSGGGAGGAAGAGGGGAGGALLIASSLTIDISGGLKAVGAGNPCSSGAAGSGGALRLIATTITGEGTIEATRGIACGFDGGDGRIRLEACSNKRVTLTIPPSTFGSPDVVFLSTNPTIRVTSIASTNTPATPAGSLTVPDVYLPTNFVNPATIKVAASNINVGTTFKVIVIPVYGANIVSSNTLSGTYASSTGSVSVAVYTDRVWRVNALIDYIPRP